MLALQAQDVALAYHGQWVLQGLSFTLQPGSHTALTGPNGVGKSSLLRILAGHLSPSQGQVTYKLQGQHIPAALRYRHLSWTGPQLELPMNLQVQEVWRLHFRSRTCRYPAHLGKGLGHFSLAGLAHQPLRQLSSGQLQRLKLGLALWTEAPLLLLDEPTEFLDAHFAALAWGWIQAEAAERTLVVATNREAEAARLPQQLRLKTTA